jgi:hypothetical protein
MCAPQVGAPIKVVLVWANHDSGVKKAPSLTIDSKNACRALLSFSLPELDRKEYQNALFKLLHGESEIQVVGVLFKRDLVFGREGHGEAQLSCDHDRTAELLGDLRREIKPQKIFVVSKNPHLSQALADEIDGRMTHDEFIRVGCSDVKSVPVSHPERSVT